MKTVFDEIPENWLSLSLKRIVKPRITDGPHETPELVNEGIPFVSAEAVENGSINFNRVRGFITREQHKLYSKKCLPQRNDIFIVKSGSTTGKIAYLSTDTEFNIWSPLALVRANTEFCSSRFLYYVLTSELFQKQVQLSWSFGTQPNIGMGVIESLRAFLPALKTQELIAQFLDRKTAAIDTLITKKQRLIQLLEEKRTALINQAVTKGLNPDAPMKDSGIPWIGEIPEHWEVKKLKRVCERITDGEHISPNLSESGIPLLSAKDIRDRKIEYDVDKFISFEDAERFRRRCNPSNGDLLLVSRGATIGRIAVVESNQIFCLMGSVILLKRNTFAHSIFLYFLMNKTSIKEELLLTSSSSAQQAIYLVDVSELIIQLPPIGEQLKIASYLDKFDKYFQTMLDKLDKQFEKLQEYRRSLITAAVTGKLDVTEEETP